MGSMLLTAPPPAPSGAQHRRRGWRFTWPTAVVAFLTLAGSALLLYPATASWLSQYQQSQLIVGLSAEQVPDSPQRATELHRAREYNDLLVSGALLEANAHKPTGAAADVAGFDYRSLLDATPEGVMGRLRVPAIDVDLPIYHGTDDVTLTKGVGHLEGTSLPVGGLSQRSVLTAHRGLPEATLFDDLDRVVVGDTFTIEVYGEVLTYQVTETKVIEPEDTDTLRVVAGKDLVTLVTCTPLGVNTHRILVTGERVTPTPLRDVQQAGAVPDIPRFPWWAVASFAVIFAVGAYVFLAGRPKQGGAGAPKARSSRPYTRRDTPEFATRPGDT